MNATVRKNTNKLLELVHDGIFTPDQVMLACLGYMSESEVSEMMRLNEFEEDIEDDDEDDNE